MIIYIKTKNVHLKKFQNRRGLGVTGTQNYGAKFYEFDKACCEFVVLGFAGCFVAGWCTYRKEIVDKLKIGIHLQPV